MIFGPYIVGATMVTGAWGIIIWRMAVESVAATERKR